MSSRMLVVSALITVHSLIANGEIITIEYSKNRNLSVCVQSIIERYFNEVTLKYINLDDGDDYLLNVLHAMKVPVAIAKWPHPSETINKGYFIHVKDESLFNNANYLIQEKYWNPHAQFIIIVSKLQMYNLRNIFDILLGLRIHNVVVVNGTDTAELYSYNAFEKNACGNYYTHIISYETCSQSLPNLYQNKARSLRNCFFRVTVPHSPPFSMDPAVIRDKVYIPGIEQYIIDLLSKVEHFSYNFSYNFNPDEFSRILHNMSVKGPLMILQNNNTDMFLGGMFLLTSRARRFSYIHGYMDYDDRIMTVVKKATVLPPWRDFYRGFSYGVWLMTFVSFILYFLLLILLFKPIDKCHVGMILLDNLFQHGSWLRSHQGPIKMFLIVWVWFTYLLNCCFSSTLVSIIRKPITTLQVRTDNQLHLYGLEPCLSLVMEGYLLEHSHKPIRSNNCCETIMDSLHIVSQSDNIYTAVPHTLFLYNIHLLKDEYGQSSVYVLEKSHSNLIYAIFVSKGFPLVHRLMTWVIKFRESGLLKKHMNDIVFWRQLRYNKFRVKEFESRVAVPWIVYAVGIFLSLGAFLIEAVLRYRIN